MHSYRRSSCQFKILSVMLSLSCVWDQQIVLDYQAIVREESDVPACPNLVESAHLIVSFGSHSLAYVFVGIYHCTLELLPSFGDNFTFLEAGKFKDGRLDDNITLLSSTIYYHRGKSVEGQLVPLQCIQLFPCLVQTELRCNCIWINLIIRLCLYSYKYWPVLAKTDCWSC